MADPIQIGIVAGEKSGDILGAGLIAALQKRHPDAEFVGIGGPDMESLGFQSLFPMERLSVMGFVEPLGRLPELLYIKRKLEAYFKACLPSIFICIDSPDFNQRIEETLKAHHIATVHYVSPSVWAYRKNRIHKIKRAVDLMLTLFPFETAIYDEFGIPATCVGHPLADQIGFENETEGARQTLGLSQSAQVVALLPGSRVSEIERLAPLFLVAAVKTLRSMPKLRFLIPFSGAESRACIERALARCSIFLGEQFRLVENSQRAMAAADFVVLASGTATLEAMLLRKPMAVFYRLAPITHLIASRIIDVPYVALPNLLAGKRLVPEAIQNEATEAAVESQILNYFSDPGAFEESLRQFDSLHRELRKGASEAASAAITELLNRS
ncbi:MAG: lipid-A-disaccharide synthase [Pseudomonadota bacterium]|nr:lipid-A-disaccharide synthase [Pseudomonadota bacterium]